MRYIIVSLGLLLTLGSLGGIKAAQIASLISFGQAAEEAGPPPETVVSAESRADSWQTGVDAVGTVTAVKGVSVNNDAAGVVAAIRFESGQEVKRGAVLVELDATVERAQLRAAIARRDLAIQNRKRTEALLKEQVSTRFQLDQDVAAVRSAEADVSLLRAEIARKVVRAPFAGKLGIREVNLGQYLTPGTPVTQLQATDAVFVDFTVPQGQTATSGMKVTVEVDGVTKHGTVSALDSRVNETSRQRMVRATVPNPKDELKPGMFARVRLLAKAPRKVVVVPATAVIHASYGDSVFVIGAPKEGAVSTFKGTPFQVVRQKFVKVGQSRGDFVEVVQGLEEGETVVAEGAFKLRQGTRVVVNNKVKNDPKLAPTPENH